MIIEKKYHFYAAHRNETLADKCSNIHGHTYYLTLSFELGEPGVGGVTVLFSDLDKLVEPIIKQFDHCFIIHVNDPLLAVLKPFGLRLMVLDNESSAENLARTLFNLINNITQLPLRRLALQETTSSTVVYEP